MKYIKDFHDGDRIIMNYDYTGKDMYNDVCKL